VNQIRYRHAVLVLFALAAWQTRAEAVTRTVCPSGCDSARIQDAINSLAGTSGNTVLVRSTYNAAASGETWPIQTLAIPGSITITGEVNGTGAPISTISFTGSPNDMLIVVSPGSVVSNLRFVPGNGNQVNRVIAAGANPGHLSHLTIRNVVIDFSSTWSSQNGIDLLADDVLIESSVVMGVTANSIVIDGDRVTIRNNTLRGFNGSVPRTQLAIGFGADEKTSSHAICSGTPTGYDISGNVIQGYLDGIHWCTGLNNNRVTNNRLEDISGKAIETSGSQGTTIANNIIRWASVSGTHGIGLSTNAFQRCDGNLVLNNQITGRPAHDVRRGISVENCTNAQLTGNVLSTFGDVDASIFFVMASLSGVTTRSVIQGNTVQDGYASGIAYLGTDTGATSADSTVVRENVVLNHRRNGIIVQHVRGASSIVAGNIVRANNLGLFANTYGVNVQHLANTQLDRNEALDTKGSGAGFFLANSQQLSGTCNTGAANGGGLLAQTNVSPFFNNPVINCRVGLFTQRDFDGDGKADVGVYRHSSGEWFIRRSIDGQLMHVAWGCPTCDDIPAPANYTAAATTDVAVYRFGTGVWYIRRSSDGSQLQVAWGSPPLGDVPVPANYSGTGRADIAVYRTSTGEWYIRNASNGSLMYVAWGCPACGDMPVPGDYDLDGRTDVAVYRRSTGEWFIRKSSDGSLMYLAWGAPTLNDLPVPSDYTQAGRADVAVYRASTGEWFIRRSTDGGLTYIPWGAPSLGDIPVPARYSVPLSDVTVYRAPRGEWFIRNPDGTTTYIPFGSPASLDAPLTSR
jgi:hypothetical protein